MTGPIESIALEGTALTVTLAPALPVDGQALATATARRVFDRYPVIDRVILVTGSNEGPEITRVFEAEREGGHGSGAGGTTVAPRSPSQAQPTQRFGDLLVSDALITQDQFDQALAEQKRTGGKLGEILVRLGVIAEARLVHFLSRRYGIPEVAFPEEIAPEIIKLIPGPTACKYGVVPTGRTLDEMTLAVADPTDVAALDDIALRTGLRVVPRLTSLSIIRQALERYYDNAPPLGGMLSKVDAERAEVDVVEGREANGQISSAGSPLLENYVHDGVVAGTSEELSRVLERVLTEARRLTRAEGGTIYVREGNWLRFTVVQNEALARRHGERELPRELLPEPLELNERSIAGFVGLTARELNVPNAYHIPPDRPYKFDANVDARLNYWTISVFLVPILDTSGTVLGVLQLINALDQRGRPVPFLPSYGDALRALVSHAAVAIANSTPGSMSAPAPASPPLEASELPRAETSAPAAVGRRLYEILIARGKIAHEDLGRALVEQNRTREKLGTILIRMGLLTEDELMLALAQQYGFRIVTLPETADPDIVRLVPAEFAKRYELIPIERCGNTLVIAMSDPTNLPALDDVAFMTGLKVVTTIAPPSIIRQAIDRHYVNVPGELANMLSEVEAAAAEIEIVKGEEANGQVDLNALRSLADEVPIVRLVNSILLDGLRRGASDIHIDPGNGTLGIRYRVDGILHEVMAPPKRVEAALVSRLKIMANLDISERRLPQDGRIKLRQQSHEIDFRVSVVPSVYGESVLLRILDKQALKADMTQLGFEPAALADFQKAIGSPHGLIVITGPTGSGKTTTLYSALGTLNAKERNIVTVEDPVEMDLPGTTQVQVNDDIGRTFAAVLRSFLRHDPDVILVGEMRDQETAQIAVRAALTGHLVLSTLHTNSAVESISRLRDMGVAPFLLSSSLRLVVAQRLVRKVCQRCREPHEADGQILIPYGHTPLSVGRCTLYKGRGCAACDFSGMKGRIALYEVLVVSPEIRGLVLNNSFASETNDVAKKQGMTTLREAGLRKVLEGVTTLEEVLRVTAE